MYYVNEIASRYYLGLAHIQKGGHRRYQISKMPKRRFPVRAAPVKRTLATPMFPVKEIPITADCWTVVTSFLTPHMRAVLKRVSKSCCSIVNRSITRTRIASRCPNLHGQGHVPFSLSKQYATRGPAWWLRMPNLKKITICATDTNRLPNWFYVYCLRSAAMRADSPLTLELSLSQDVLNEHRCCDADQIGEILADMGKLHVHFHTIHLKHWPCIFLRTILATDVDLRGIRIYTSDALDCVFAGGAQNEKYCQDLFTRLAHFPRDQLPTLVFGNLLEPLTDEHAQGDRIREIFAGRIIEE